MKKFIFWAVAIMVVLSACKTSRNVSAEPDLTPQKHVQCWCERQLFDKNVENAGGGQGTLYGKFAFRREQALEMDAIKEIGWMTLKKGTYIGKHLHKDNEDAYLIISGKGIFTDSDGNEIEVGPGDMTIARPGQSHGLSNPYGEDLVFLDIIAKNSAADLEAIMANPTGQVFLLEKDLFEKNVEKAGGGVGTLYGKFAFRREQATDDQAIKEIGLMTLKPGDSIGFHQHKDNDDTYIIISGTGTFTDNNKVKTVVGPKAVTIAGPGESHALENTGKEDLVFIDLIAKNHAYKAE